MSTVPPVARSHDHLHHAEEQLAQQAIIQHGKIKKIKKKRGEDNDRDSPIKAQLGFFPLRCAPIHPVPLPIKEEPIYQSPKSLHTTSPQSYSPLPTPHTLSHPGIGLHLEHSAQH